MGLRKPGETCTPISQPRDSSELGSTLCKCFCPQWSFPASRVAQDRVNYSGPEGVASYREGFSSLVSPDFCMAHSDLSPQGGRQERGVGNGEMEGRNSRARW